MQNRIATVAQLYGVISHSASLGPVPVVPTSTASPKGCDRACSASLRVITVTVAADPLLIGAEYAVTLGLVVNELATNAIKYAFPHGQGRLTIGFARDGVDAVLTIADDGVGLNATTDTRASSGLGSRFVETFVSQLKATMATATDGSGTTFTVRLPGSILVEEAQAPS